MRRRPDSQFLFFILCVIACILIVLASGGCRTIDYTETFPDGTTRRLNLGVVGYDTKIGELSGNVGSAHVDLKQLDTTQQLASIVGTLTQAIATGALVSVPVPILPTTQPIMFSPKQFELLREMEMARTAGTH